MNWFAVSRGGEPLEAIRTATAQDITMNSEGLTPTVHIVDASALDNVPSELCPDVVYASSAQRAWWNRALMRGRCFLALGTFLENFVNAEVSRAMAAYSEAVKLGTVALGASLLDRMTLVQFDALQQPAPPDAAAVRALNEARAAWTTRCPPVMTQTAAHWTRLWQLRA